MKFLIVEDEAVSRLLLQRVLQDQGYEVLVAKDGREGWEIFQREKKDIYLLIVDWMMPVMSGLELCKKIREAETSHYVYIIFLSAKGEKKDIVRGLKAGADDYLTKPFDKEELFSRINVGLRIIRLEQALKAANQKLYLLATLDGLTKILNRRELLNRLKEELSRASRRGTTFYLFMLDIDRFKKVNDEYGHEAGDRVLIEVVDRIKSRLRSYDVFGRYGGEEFLIGISEADKGIAREIAERLRRCICEKPFNIGGRGLTVSISIGLAEVKPSRNIDLEAAIRKADTALYKAKQQGRNRVVCIE